MGALLGVPWITSGAPGWGEGGDQVLSNEPGV
jgi:hypothetical protein